MMAPKYPVGTLLEMAAIPVEALPRFLAELPVMLAEMRGILEMQRDFNASFAEVAHIEIGTPLWVDDDKGQTTITLSADGIDGELSHTRPQVSA